MEAAGTVEKAVDVLFELHAAPGSQGVTELGRALGLPKSSVHRLLAALCRGGLVERDGRGRYRPGMGLVALGLGALEREPSVLAAEPVLAEQAERFGETFFLVGARAGRLRVLAKAEGTGFLRAAPTVGSEVPVHATAVGKLFLAQGDGSVTLPSGALEAFTPFTLTGRADLARAVARVREQGFAHSQEEWIAGLSVLAAPVRTGGRLRGALAMGAPSARLSNDRVLALEPPLKAAADRIAARLEGRVR